MNPTSGSFDINQRLQRHFSAFTVNFPAPESLTRIYSQLLTSFLAPFPLAVQKAVDRLTTAALALHKKVTATFLPTAVRFHYIFNLRDLSNIYQCILFTKPSTLQQPMDLIRIWVHECLRVYGDKLVDRQDGKVLVSSIQEVVKKTFEDVDVNAVFAEPLIYAHFAGGIGDVKYQPVTQLSSLKKILEEALEGYNELNSAMDLVLFEDAMQHVVRINRILENPRGNALLVGVGGSGKQSLARLAASISSFDVFQINLRKGYGMADLKIDLCALYLKTGQKKSPMVFLLTDSQIADEKFLVLINDLLASGDIPGLFPDDEIEGIVNSMRAEAKQLGVLDTREGLWSLFIKNVRKYLKVVLCFSPVGSTLRNRCRKFPAIVNSTMIDWFHEWPQEALISVASRFVDSFDLVPVELRSPVTQFMAFAHQSVNDVSRKYRENERRHNYTTPKSFLEYINLYKSILERKSSELTKSMERLDNGLTKLQSTAAQVDDLKARLSSQEVELKVKNEEANRLIERVAIDTDKVNKEKAVADEEEKKVSQNANIHETRWTPSPKMLARSSDSVCRI